MDGRVSFSFEGLPDGIHFTISWTNPNNINLHITKNTGDSPDKPKIIIAIWNKNFVDAFMPYIPAIIIGKLYEPLSFKKYSRQSRKNIRIVYFDEIENQVNNSTIEDDISKIFNRHSSIKKKKLKIKTTLENDLLPFLRSSPIGIVFINNLRSLNPNSFASESSRCGLIFMGNKKYHFVTYKNRCFILKKRRNIQEFFKLFMKSELVDSLTTKIKKALIEIQNASTYTDTIPHNTPYQLFLES